MTDQEKTYISLSKNFLSLQYKLTKYEMSGLNPPEDLLKTFQDTKRRLRILSKALEKEEKTENWYMMPQEKKSLTDKQKNVKNLRYRLTKYKIAGITPPESLLIELKMAELLVKVESMDTIRVNAKV